MGSDILWYNTSDGAMQVWFMDGPRCRNRLGVQGEDGANVFIGPPWSIAAVGDFDGDGKPDILWYNTSDGAMQVWFMDGPRCRNRLGVQGEDGANVFIGPPSSIAAVGDFDGDGKPDILWYNASDGAMQVWFMDGPRCRNRLGVQGEDGANVFIGPPWSIAAVGDFDLDGREKVKRRAAVYNVPPFPLGLPLDDKGHPVAEPVILREADGTFVAHFRGGTVRERPIGVK